MLIKIPLTLHSLNEITTANVEIEKRPDCYANRRLCNGWILHHVPWKASLWEGTLSNYIRKCFDKIAWEVKFFGITKFANFQHQLLFKLIVL